jgi:hypothetical protein
MKTAEQEFRRAISTTIAHDLAPRQQPTALPSMTGDELTDVLLRLGGRLVAHEGHGDFLAIRHHLVFVRSATFVEQRELWDVLRAAGVTASELQDVLADARGSAVGVPRRPV